jgi:hypothetical protein
MHLADSNSTSLPTERRSIGEKPGKLPSEVVSSGKFQPGDYLTEDANDYSNPHWKGLACLIRHGQLINYRPFPGMPSAASRPYLRWEDGSEGFANEVNLKLIDRPLEQSIELGHCYCIRLDSGFVEATAVPTETNETHGRVCLLPSNKFASFRYGDGRIVQLPIDRVQFHVSEPSPLERLCEERAQLESDGLGPAQGWIETGKVKGRDFRQAWWRSKQPIFAGKKTRYIGKQGSPEHRRAIEQKARRKRWERVCKQIQILEKEIGDA